MPAGRVHLVRHGEVFNPNRVLYGRLPGYGLSDDGRQMAEQAAAWIGGLERPLASLIVSPLQRAQESAQPFIDRFGLRATTDERVIEPTNVFEGKRMKRALDAQDLTSLMRNESKRGGSTAFSLNFHCSSLLFTTSCSSVMARRSSTTHT